MKYPAIAKMVLERGIDNVSIPEQIRFESLSEAGQLLFKENRYEESGKAFQRAGNLTALHETADWLSQQGLHKQASYFFIHTANKEKIEKCALACMEQGFYEHAKSLFESTGNIDMLSFISQNFDI